MAPTACDSNGHSALTSFYSRSDGIEPTCLSPLLMVRMENRLSKSLGACADYFPRSTKDNAGGGDRWVRRVGSASLLAASFHPLRVEQLLRLSCFHMLCKCEAKVGTEGHVSRKARTVRTAGWPACWRWFFNSRSFQYVRQRAARRMPGRGAYIAYHATWS